MRFEKRLFVVYTLVLNAICKVLTCLTQFVRRFIYRISVAAGATNQGYRRENETLQELTTTTETDLRSNEMEQRWLVEGFDPDKDVKFLLFTTKNSESPQYLETGNEESFKSSNFDSNNEIRLVPVSRATNEKSCF